MATIKSYTDLEQSKKLAEILPLKSADMCYPHFIKGGANTYAPYPECADDIDYPYEMPCWSLAALLDVLNKTAYFIDEDASVNLSSYKTVEWNLGINNSDLELITESNPIDACCEMILKLHDNNLL